MDKQVKKIVSLNQLQVLMPRLLVEHAKDGKLMKAALSNPILALETLGYTIVPKVKREIEQRSRFNAAQQKRRMEIEEKVNKLSPKKLDLSSSASITRVLKNIFTEKTIDVGKKTMQTSAFIAAASKPLPPQMFQKKAMEDPLSTYKSAHPIIPLLLEYRKLEAVAPKFASKKTFTSILNDNDNETKFGISISNVNFKIQERSKRKTR